MSMVLTNHDTLKLEGLTVEEQRLALRVVIILREHRLEDYVKVEVVRQGAKPPAVGYQIGARSL